MLLYGMVPGTSPDNDEMVGEVLVNFLICEMIRYNSVSTEPRGDHQVILHAPN